MSKGRLAVIALAVAGLVFVALWRGGSQAPVLRVGAPAPGFALASLEGPGPHTLDDQAGKIVLVNFWATWCAPCLEEMPAMQRLYEALPREHFELLAISVDEGDEEVRAFRDRLALSFPILLDPAREAATAFQTFRFPESFLVGRDGRIAARYIGPKEWDSDLYIKHLRDLVARP